MSEVNSKYIDWNQMSELGLIRRINTEILHPIGLAMSRDVETGTSSKIFIADDGEWEYQNEGPTPLSYKEIRKRIEELNEQKEK